MRNVLWQERFELTTETICIICIPTVWIIFGWKQRVESLQASVKDNNTSFKCSKNFQILTKNCKVVCYNLLKHNLQA